MRLFGYYAFHTFVNQLKKILKPWVLIFVLACGLMGGLIGYGTARLEETAESRHEEVVEEEEELPEELEDLEELSTFPLRVEDGFVIIETENYYNKVAIGDVAELLILLVILAVLFWNMLSADKNGSKIFLMADVNLLFSAPMKPQSVLLFRLMCQFAMSLLATFYLAFQIPNLVLNLGVSVEACIALLVTWLASLIIAKVMQIMLYTICSTHIQLKKYLTPFLWGILFCLLAAFASFTKAKGMGYIDGAIAFFNAPFTRWIPFVGWLKGLFMFTYEGNLPMALLCAGLLLVGSVILVWLIWNLKADFYEDAMAKSEQTASLQEAVKEGRATSMRVKKDRSDKIRRDQFRHGAGANVLFTKSLYNRFRFARFGTLTKTVLTYLGVVLAGWFLHDRFDTPFSFMIAVMAVGIFVFFRGLGNPLEEDTRMSFFVMIPENTWVKLFWSVLAGTANSLLDLLPALVLAAVLTGTGPLQVVAWIGFLLSIDLYASITSAFIGMAVPQSVGQTIKSIILVFFVYFGLVPDILAIALGYVFEHMLTGILAAVIVNFVLATIFFLLIPLFLDPKKGRRPDVKPVSEEIRLQGKKDFAWLAFSMAVVLVGASLLQLGLARLVNVAFPSFWENQYSIWIVTFLPIYAVAFPVGIAMMKKVPAWRVVSVQVQKSASEVVWSDSDDTSVVVTEAAATGTTKKGAQSAAGSAHGHIRDKKYWTLPAMLLIFLICVGGMYGGNLIGALVNYTISLYVPQAPINPLETFATEGAVWIRILCLVVLAPCLEEYLFRKQLISRMYPYGEKTAVIVSAVMFGLFHGNFSQFFYATILGLIFGYVYVRSGKLRYSISLHMVINFMGSILSVWLLEHANADLAALDQLEEGVRLSAATWGLLGYVAFMILGSIAGLLILGICWEKITFLPTEKELGKGQVFKTTFLNWGMALFVIGSGILFYMAL